MQSDHPVFTHSSETFTHSSTKYQVPQRISWGIQVKQHSTKHLGNTDVIWRLGVQYSRQSAQNHGQGTSDVSQYHHNTVFGSIAQANTIFSKSLIA